MYGKLQNAEKKLNEEKLRRETLKKDVEREKNLNCVLNKTNQQLMRMKGDYDQKHRSFKTD